MKWIKWISAIVVVLIILVISARPLIEWRMLPSNAFSSDNVPDKPDYSDTYFWISLPDKSDSADLIPPNAFTDEDIHLPQVDVFFIHSTGYVGPGGWNSNMQADNSEIQSTEYMLTSMASIFNGCCHLYAPHYREAHLVSFASEDTQSSFDALDLAYDDVETAFDYFLEYYSQGRPFMIVSHSQGSLHALRLLENRIDGEPLAQRMVAAYTLGYWLPLDKFERSFTSLKVCSSAEQTGCIVSFDSYGEGGKLSGQSRQWYRSGWEVVDNTQIVCTNPISWSTNTERALAEQHHGAMPVEFKRTFWYMLTAQNPDYKFTELPPLVNELTWAQCGENGELFVQEQLEGPFSNHFNDENKSYHLLDFSLFYGNIRSNAILRTSAYFKKGR